MDIKKDVVGRILSDQYAGLDNQHVGWLMKIEDDGCNVGSYLVLFWEDKEGGEGCDDWVENDEKLLKYFNNHLFVVEWGVNGG